MLRYIAMIEPPSGALQCCSTVRSPSVPVHAPATHASCSTEAFTGEAGAGGWAETVATVAITAIPHRTDAGTLRILVTLCLLLSRHFLERFNERLSPDRRGRLESKSNHVVTA